MTPLRWPQLNSVLGWGDGEILWLVCPPGCRPEGWASPVSYAWDTQLLCRWNTFNDPCLPFDSWVAEGVWVSFSLYLPPWTQAHPVSPAPPREAVVGFRGLLSASSHGWPLRQRSKGQVASISSSLSNAPRIGILGQTQQDPTWRNSCSQMYRTMKTPCRSLTNMVYPTWLWNSCFPITGSGD